MKDETKTIQDEFIRDVCSVTPMPKSEVRRRLNEILQSRNEEVEAVIENMNCAVCGINSINVTGECHCSYDGVLLLDKNEILSALKRPN